MGSTFKRSRKRKDGTTYMVWVCEDTLDGKSKTTTGKTEKEAKAKMRAWMREMAEYGEKLAKTRDAFGLYFNKYLFDVLLNEVADSTFTRYVGIYNSYVRDSSIAPMKPDTITYADMQLYFNDLRSKGLSQASMNKTKCLLNGCFKYAKVNKVIRDNPLDNFRIPKSVKLKKEIRILTIEEQTRYVQALEGSKLRIALLLAMFTGLRAGELIALTWDSLEEGTLRINKSLKRTRVYDKNGEYIKRDVLKATKTDRVRYVPVPDFLLEELNKMDKTAGYIFVTSKGTHYTVDNIRREHIRICTLAKVGKPTKVTYTKKRKRKNGTTYTEIREVEEYQEVNFHALRHTYATRLYKYGEDIKIIQSLLGHTKLSTTMDIYTHVFERDVQGVANRLDKIYQDVNGNA